MKLHMYQVDAFASKVFTGNPAAVVPLENWLEDDLMQRIACENNLSETAFFVQEGEKYHIRWFTPTSEVAMCGHATLASAFVLFHELGYKNEKIVFSSKSGDLIVKQVAEMIEMDFPLQSIKRCEAPEAILKAFNSEVQECFVSMDYIVVFEHEKDVENLEVDLQSLKGLDARGVIVTAKSKKYDFVCRFFAPKYGVSEDPVTGSAFTQLATYYSQVLQKESFHAKQVSQRGGEVFCRVEGERVFISGCAVKYLEGSIDV